ncbi:MAG TPA: DUF3426 domain-containing protein [Woeseiaceae bacterium]
MYTQCPDCNEVFRVTADILQQASGRVRCGACGHVFNALDGLSEGPPSPGEPPSRRDREAIPTGIDDLDEDDGVTIEDTGVEWRVVEVHGGAAGDADDASDDAGESALRWYIHDESAEPGNDARIPESAAARRQPSLELQRPEAGEQRYDDNTPLPGLVDDEDDDAFPLAEPPRRRAEDWLEPRAPELDERQVDLALGDPEEWTDLLEEVGQPDTPDAAAHTEAPSVGDDAPARPGEPVDEPTAEHPALHPGLDIAAADEGEAALTLADDTPAAGDERDTTLVPADDASEGADESLALVEDDASGDEPLTLVDEAAPVPEGPEAAPASDRTGRREVPAGRDDEEAREQLIDADLLRASGRLEDLAASGARAAAAPLPHVETIIMEGDLVKSSLHGELTVSGILEEMPPAEPAAAPEIQGKSLRDTYLRVRDGLPARREDVRPRRPLAIAAVLLLGVLLAAQIVHAHRRTLATRPVFADTVGVLYSRLGAPITPEWNVNGWQFETTSGGTDASDRILTISASVSNRTEHALPYPLLHVGLTDRYEEIVSGELLKPEQYLELRSAEGMVDAGERFTATVTIAPVAPDVSGYKLNVCYPLSATKVRCATGAFRNH